MDDKVKSILNAIKLERKKKNKNANEVKKLEKESVKMKYSKNPNKLQSALKESNEIQLHIKNLREIRQEILVNYTGEFEMVGNLEVRDQIRQTHIRFRKITDYEAYINSVDEGYDVEDAIFNGYL